MTETPNNTPDIVDESCKIPTEAVKLPKNRTIEELENVATKAMNPAEIKKYVDHLRDENRLLQSQLKSLKEAFVGVQTQKDQQAQLFQQYQLAAKTQLQFCKDTVAQAYKTLHYMQPLEDITGGNN